MVIELIENCIKAGFDEKAALELVNSAYIAGGRHGESRYGRYEYY